VSAVERRTGLANFFELEDRLDFLGALARLDKDEAQDIAPGQSDLGVFSDLLEDCLHVRLVRNNLGLTRRGDFPGNRGVLFQGGDEDLELDEGSIREVYHVHMRAVL
jgi:hypothetical protein